MRIIVLGYIVRCPLGGLAWHYLQYVLGLKKMGHDVLFLEDSDNYISCYNPVSNEMTTDPGYGLNFIKQVFEELGMPDQWGYYDGHRDQWFGLSEKEVQDFCASADLLLNISGVNVLRQTTAQIPRRVLIDTDPAFTQIRHLTEPDALAKAKEHNYFFSFGENLGKPSCSIPDDGLNWLPTRQPVVLDAWKNIVGNIHAPWTTVMQWDSNRVREYNGKKYGMKSSVFYHYLNLPLLINEHFELAVGSATAPKELLTQNGWKVSDSLIPTKSPWTYQEFICNSKAEWSIAKEGYVMTNSGWFSERSAGYLASGRPVVLQDTGFSKWLTTECGVLSFNNLAEAIAALEEVNSHYEKHCRAAREVAEAYFDASKVLTDLIERT